ncbi:sensory histidine kinase AtoS [bacterium BMS3Abin05]|nr:sensory histidine kinase AtoS [bacterium BMS3Abin05]GBE28257.1 sensory histidine kinase AtoS [bacterium BMS3Bbin03]HDL78264.1 ATP-binding protein [Bacteroidota bacterium]
MAESDSKQFRQITGKLKRFRFELKHIIVLFMILILFQLLVSLVHKISLQRFLKKTQDWYQQDSAERLANLTATSLELLVETRIQNKNPGSDDARKTIEALNIILSQEILQHNVQDVCVLVEKGGRVAAIDNGRVLYAFIFKNDARIPPSDEPHPQAIQMYGKIKKKLQASEQIVSILKGRETYHVFVPFVPKGEYMGALYMKNTPEFSGIASEIISSYNETSLIFVALIFLGLLAMFYISSYTVKERDAARELLYREREKQLEEHIHFQKEALFAKRIYHTHHKAEKVMGFIKEDLQSLNAENMEEVTYRVSKYANFISRVIYDMKWYDPPVQTIRNPMFRSDLNELIRFIVKYIFLRISRNTNRVKFHLELDESLPVVHVNEFVAWEILEPLIQNSIDHGGDGELNITIHTCYFPDEKESKIFISDDGQGIRPDLLEENEEGIKRIFLENISTKDSGDNSGYGCYIAYEISRQRCGWSLDAENLPEKGCQFIVSIPH